MMPDIGSVLVVVPARNEEDRVARCLRSVLVAAAGVRRQHGVVTWIVVAADGCEDRTVHTAGAILLDQGTVLAGNWCEVGSARRAGVAAGLEHLRNHGPTWIANTDADCEVPADWLIDQIDHAHTGSDAVLGIVSVDSFDEHPAGIAEVFERLYVLGRDGTHEHVHGANFGVRADRYLEAGGWPCVAVSEDHGLAGGLIALGASIVRTIDVSVTTSGRRSGRATGGFADMLVDLGESA